MRGQITYQIFRNHPDVLCQTIWLETDSVPIENKDGPQADLWFDFLKDSFFTSEELVYARQVHGNQVEQVTVPGVAGQCDGLATSRQKLPLLIRTADCASVMLFNPAQKSIANLHVGWRGARAGIISAGIEKFSNGKTDSFKKMEVAVSPMIRGCCYEVGTEFHEYFEDKYFEERQGKIFFQLQRIIADQLLAAGILTKQIEFSEECTHCSQRRLPSFRRDKTQNRLLNVIEIKEY
jgi:YfiH family protein